MNTKLFESLLNEVSEDEIKAFNKKVNRFDNQRTTARFNYRHNHFAKTAERTYEYEICNKPLTVTILSPGTINIKSTYSNDSAQIETDDYNRICKWLSIMTLSTRYKQEDNLIQFDIEKFYTEIKDTANDILDKLKDYQIEFDANDTKNAELSSRIDKAIAHRADKLDAEKAELMRRLDAENGELHVGDTVYGNWKVKSIDKENGTVKLVSPNGAVRNYDLDTVTSKNLSNLKLHPYNVWR